MKKENKNQKAVAVVIAVFVFLISLVTLFFSFYAGPVYTQELEIRFEVGENGTGVNLDRTDIIDFGKISSQSSGIGRIISVRNFAEYPVELFPVFQGQGKDFLSAPEGEIFAPGELKNISLWLSIPKDAALGNYSATVKFQLRSVKG